MTLPKTKIVCTIGPASNSPEVMTALIENGMSVARLNFSHGTHPEHGQMIRLIRETSRKVGRPVAILQDLCGPKIRVGEIPGLGMQLSSGQTLILTNEQSPAHDNRIPVSYGDLPSQVKSGDRILLADGMMELLVEQTTLTEIVCKVITGGVLTSYKGVNLPTSTLTIPSMTEKDRRDLLFGLEADVDYVALSFVRSAADIHMVKKIIHRQNKQTPVIAKFEKHEALDNVDAILAAADGVMVARGDLGVEVALENVPSIQKMLVRKANSLGKPVIIATQMLRSMVDAPRPTRAEAADVANAVLDGADAIMLSEETAVGRHPVEAVHYMSLIAHNAEQNYPHNFYLRMAPQKGTAESVANAACTLAKNLEAAAIVATTRSGSTAAQIARYRPKQLIVALSPDVRAVHRLALYWGCIPTYLDNIEDTDAMVEKAAEAVMEKGHVRKGEKMVITAGRPIWAAGTTNMLWVKTL
ncbi:MAG: pyruvate kinase [Desulfobacteraceae bacterium]|nr:MAG: pyruvate kinase [Desulfobacteraceae bacterium]